MQGILLIASNPNIEKTFYNMLSDVYQVYCTGSEEEGLIALDEHYRNIAAVLIELRQASINASATRSMPRIHSHSPNWKKCLKHSLPASS